jgi:hypothetical protein
MNKLLIVVALAAFTGCTTLNPDTGKKEFDPIKTANVKAVIRPVLSGVTRRLVEGSPESAAYVRTIGSVFCEMSTTGKLSPLEVATAVDQSLRGKQVGVDPLIIDAKNALLALYEINYNGRFTAELSPEKWPKNVADVICASTDQALKDAGLAGIN